MTSHETDFEPKPLTKSLITTRKSTKMTLCSSQVKIILASESTFRAELLGRLKVEFSQISAQIDETEKSDESPSELTIRLAHAKAQTILEKFQDTHGEIIVIGSDQVACHKGKILGKPHTRDNAISQLRKFSGERVDFLTAVAVHTREQSFEHIDCTSVYFKTLSDQLIQNYVDQEDVLNCAGSFKSEGLGICLFQKIENSDPTALIGLPMIWLSDCLQRLNIKLP
jgi:MAF protein